MNSNDILVFWFETLEPKDWWVKNPDLDNKIKLKFQNIHRQAHNNELSKWRTTSKGSLAEILILDQFSRNIYRDTPKAFASDKLALQLSEKAISNGFDKTLNETERSFLYMPYMHSESLEAHEKALELFEGMKNYEFEVKHKNIIDRFGRYPHRNNILGRVSTTEEIEFLKGPNSSF